MDMSGSCCRVMMLSFVMIATQTPFMQGMWRAY